MNITIRQNVIRSTDGRIKFKKFRESGREHYHLGVWIDGDDRDLDRIEYVEYLLHPTFNNPIRKSANRRNNFSITFWTWGMFEIQISIYIHSEGKETYHHRLTYELPADESYVDVS